tara:strand:- start:113 stop:400 length:288 start_codon:yes stop_codon:yes gene_type:complete
VSSILTTTTKKYKIMTRNQLKQLWFSIPRDENKKDFKAIIVEMGNNPHWPGYGEVQIVSDTKDGYSSFKTHQEFPMEYALDCKEYKLGTHQLIVK